MWRHTMCYIASGGRPVGSWLGGGGGWLGGLQPRWWGVVAHTRVGFGLVGSNPGLECTRMGGVWRHTKRRASKHGPTYRTHTYRRPTLACRTGPAPPAWAAGGLPCAAALHLLPPPRAREGRMTWQGGRAECGQLG